MHTIYIRNIYVLYIITAEDADRDAIERQWRNLRTMRISEICENDDENISTIDFWIAVNKIENANSSKRFKDLAAFALRALSLPISNADVERVFSVMAVIKTKCRDRMLINMLVSLMRIRIHMRVFELCCKNYMLTDDMLKRLTSQMYESQKVTKKSDEDDNDDNIASDNFLTAMNLLEYSEDNNKDDIDDIYD